MNKLTWKDVTSYSQSKTRVQSSWELQAGKFNIFVTNSHVYYPGAWVMHADPICREYELGDAKTMSVEEAQQAAIEVFKRGLSSALKAVS